MKYYYQIIFSYLFLTLLPVLAGLFRYKKLDKATKVLLLMLLLSFAGELTAFISAKVYHTNNMVYNISNIFGLIITTIYFNYAINFLKERKLGYYINAVSVMIAVITFVLSNRGKEMNNYFMVYEGLAVICMSLVYLVQLYKTDPFIKYPYTPHFWFSLLFIFFWTLTLLNWTLYDYLSVIIKPYKYLLDLFIIIVASLTYFGFSIVLFFYPKMDTTHGS